MFIYIIPSFLLSKPSYQMPSVLDPFVYGSYSKISFLFSLTVTALRVK